MRITQPAPTDVSGPEGTSACPCGGYLFKEPEEILAARVGIVATRGGILPDDGEIVRDCGEIITDFPEIVPADGEIVAERGEILTDCVGIAAERGVIETKRGVIETERGEIVAERVLGTRALAWIGSAIIPTDGPHRFLKKALAHVLGAGRRSSSFLQANQAVAVFYDATGSIPSPNSNQTTMSTSNPTKLIQPYLFFNGRCEEAIEFYRTALGGEIQMIMRYKESPDPAPPGMVPAGWDEKIMHASLRVGEAVLMASDGCNEEKPGFAGFSLSLSVPNEAEANRAFNALAQSGQVRMPLTKTFWSPCFGMVEDRFGVGWMVSVLQ